MSCISSESLRKACLKLENISDVSEEPLAESPFSKKIRESCRLHMERNGLKLDCILWLK